MEIITQPTNVAAPADGGLNGLTPYGHQIVLSVRSDYRDAPKYNKCWCSSPTTITRIEHNEATFSHTSGSYKIISGGVVNSIRMLNVPIAKYILYANGVALLTTTNGYFDLSTQSQTLLAFIAVSESASGTLNLGKFDDVKICYSAFVADVLPDSIEVEYGTNTPEYPIVRDRLCKSYYNLCLSHPTEQLCIVFHADEIYARVCLWLGRGLIFDSAGPWDIGPNKLVFKFNGFCADGAAYHMFGDVPHATYNMSRAEAIATCTNGALEKVYSTYYMTYYVPSELNDDLMKRYTT